MTTPSATRGATLREWRQRRGYTLRRLANRVNTTEQNISAWERGAWDPRDPSVLADIDAVLEADGAILAAYGRTSTTPDLAARVAGLEQRMTDIEAVRDEYAPVIRANGDQIVDLWKELHRLARRLQRLVGPAQPAPEPPPCSTA